MGSVFASLNGLTRNLHAFQTCQLENDTGVHILEDGVHASNGLMQCHLVG